MENSWGSSAPTGQASPHSSRQSSDWSPFADGFVTLRGRDISNLAAHTLVSLGVGYVPQRANVFPSLTVEDNLRMGLYLNPKAWDERLAAVVEIFPLLADRSDQRAGLSLWRRTSDGRDRASPHDGSFGPAAGRTIRRPLPRQSRPRIRTRSANCRPGVSIVMVEQNARRCLQIADRAYVLDQGRNAYTGTGHELLHDPKVVDLYLGTLGRVD